MRGKAGAGTRGTTPAPAPLKAPPMKTGSVLAADATRAAALRQHHAGAGALYIAAAVGVLGY